jgi:hypothetical protein
MKLIHRQSVHAAKKNKTRHTGWSEEKSNKKRTKKRPTNQMEDHATALSNTSKCTRSAYQQPPHHPAQMLGTPETFTRKNSKIK